LGPWYVPLLDRQRHTGLSVEEDDVTDEGDAADGAASAECRTGQEEALGTFMERGLELT
jgi:hypothetical protein